MRWFPLLAGMLVGCAAAGSGGGGNPDGNPGGDGNPTTDGGVDAVAVDAAPQMVTMSQNTSTAVVQANSFACAQTNYTRDNSYYRVFPLSDHGVTGAMQITQVTFSVETADAGGAAVSQAAQVKVGTYTGALGGDLTPANITPIASEAILIPDGVGTVVTVPIDPVAVIPAGSMNVIVEVAIPDGLAAQNTFFIGTNAAGEQRPGYISSQTCGINVPRGMNTVGASQVPPLPKADIIMSATGTF